MKTPLFLVPLLLAVAAPLHAMPDLPPQVVYHSAKIQIVYNNPSKFTDIRDSYMPTDKGELSILRELAESLENDAKSEVPNGDTLTLTFNNIKLAGDFEPWHGPNWDDIRVVRDVYIPFFDFAFKLTDASGRVIKQGTEHLSDMNFQMRPLINTDDPLRYEKDILREWVQDHVKR